MRAETRNELPARGTSRLLKKGSQGIDAGIEV
jgi:hypothetical protein